MTAPESSLMSRLVSLCKRRGFVYPASEIYGGLNGFWDFGPLGVQLKNNLRDAWWRDMVECPPLGPDGKPLSIVGIDTSIIQHPQTWIASGHVGGFSDLMVDDRETKLRYRADHIICIELSFEKAGNVESLGWLSALDGDEAEAALAKKRRRRPRKPAAAKSSRSTFSKAIPFTAFHPKNAPRSSAPTQKTPAPSPSRAHSI